MTTIYMKGKFMPEVSTGSCAQFVTLRSFVGDASLLAFVVGP